MKKETFEKLVDKMAMHFPSQSGGVAGYGNPGQEPYRTDLLKILIQAFKNRNKEDNTDPHWDSFSEELVKEVLAKRPHLTLDQISMIFAQISNMWNEWLYILRKIRAENITLVEHNTESHGSTFIAVE